MLKVIVLGLCCAIIYGQNQTCDYGGSEYNTGDSFPATDGCNRCKCHNGAVACTLMFCIGGGLSLGSNCHYNGTDYHNGDTFDATDGCNTCTCEHGSIACTEMFCNPHIG